MANDQAAPKAPAPPASTDAGQIPPAAGAAKPDEAAANKVRSRGLHFLSAIATNDADKVGRMLRGADK